MWTPYRVARGQWVSEWVGRCTTPGRLRCRRVRSTPSKGLKPVQAPASDGHKRSLICNGNCGWDKKRFVTVRGVTSFYSQSTDGCESNRQNAERMKTEYIIRAKHPFIFWIVAWISKFLIKACKSISWSSKGKDCAALCRKSIGSIFVGRIRAIVHEPIGERSCRL